MQLPAALGPHSFTHKKSLVVSEIGFALYALIFVFLGISLIAVEHVRPSVLSYATNIRVADIVADTNSQRLANGDKPLTENAALDAAAQAKANDMFAKDYWSHFGPNGETPWQFIQAAGYGYVAAGENLARDFDDSNAVVQAWMHSPSHRENLLNSKYQDIGVAVVNGTLLGHETTLVVQEFGDPYVASTNVIPPGNDSQTTVAAAPQPTNTPIIQPQVAGANDQVAQEQPAPDPIMTTSANPLNPLAIIRIIGISFMIFAILFLAIDAIMIRKRGVSRIASHSVSHIAILTVIAIGVVLLQSGRIL